MPKASRISTPDNAGVLKRNQACHQCRKRKLKCDAKRPCSTCVRSHTHAIAHAQPGVQLPQSPECTFDEVATGDSAVACAETSTISRLKERYEVLENRVLELEAQLKQKEQQIAPWENPPGGLTAPSFPTNHAPSLSTHDGSCAAANDHSDSDPLQVHTNGLRFTTDPYAPHDALSIFEIADKGAIPPPLQLGNAFQNSPKVEFHKDRDILWPHWPQHLPDPYPLRHIVEVFFLFHPHATRLLSMPTFMTSLSLPPTHPGFPSLPILHAICAVGAMYSPVPAASGHRSISGHENECAYSRSFAEQHALHAKKQVDLYLVCGRKPAECLQALVLLSWYYWSHARWMELFVCAGQALRVSLPLAANLCAPFHALNACAQSMSITPPPQTSAEEEMRRNTFWLAYSIDRQHGASNGWASSLNDEDIAQLLPIPEKERSLNVAPSAMANTRQWSHMKETLLVHPHETTDSFTLYVKSAMVISRIKDFNHRFRMRESLGDPASKIEESFGRKKQDIPSAPAFIDLEQLVVSFRASLPHNMKDPFADGRFDTHLYTTHLTLHLAIILLHEPHSNPQVNSCTSAMKILIAARGILDLIYAVWSTNYELGLLDLFCPFCWYSAGRVFGRFLKAAQDASSIPQVETLQGELRFIRAALMKMGERVPLSGRYQRMLDMTIAEVCGSASSLAVAIRMDGKPTPTVADDSLLFGVAQATIPRYDLGTYMYFTSEATRKLDD